MVLLANYIQDLHHKINVLEAENTRSLILIEVLEKALQEERASVGLLLEEKDKVILHLEEHVQLLKASRPGFFEKAGTFAGGAGIAAAIILLGGILR